jgi:hypothetical protein
MCHLYKSGEKFPDKGFSIAVLFINIFVRRDDISSGILQFPVTAIGHQYVFFKEQNENNFQNFLRYE